MKKVIVILIVLALLFFTNPSKDEYVTWVKEKSTEGSGAVEKGVVSLFGNLIFKETTTSSDYFLFTIFETKIDKDMPHITIGILKNFIQIR